MTCQKSNNSVILLPYQENVEDITELLDSLKNYREIKSKFYLVLAID